MDTTVPNPTTPSAEPAKASEPAAKPAKAKKKKGGFFKGCLIFLVVLLLLIGAVLAVLFRLPEKLGIVRSPAEKLYSGTPFREEAGTMLAEMQAQGIDTKGVELTVFPVTDSDQVVALATLDASQGFLFEDSADGEEITDTFVRMASGPTATDIGLDRIAIAYKDAKGRQLMAMTAPTDAIKDFAEKRITKEQFYERMDGRMDIPNLTIAFQEQLDELQE